MSARILVVDDTPLNVKLLTAKLAKDYYFVSTAASGTEALDAVKRDMPDLILLDIMMPDMNGFEVCTHLKKDPVTRHIPVVMVTALSDVKDRVRGLECGADDFITKPINDIALFARVRSLLRLKMMMDEWRLRAATAAQFSPSAQPEEEENTDNGRILMLEDDENECARIEKALDGKASLRRVNSPDQIMELTRENAFDLVMISLDPAGSNGLYLCGQLRANEGTRTLPILLVAQESEIEQVAKGLDLGANDYLLRPVESTELLARARTQIRQKRHYDRLRKNLEKSLSLALVDPLTGAYNRRYLDMHMPPLFARCRSSGRPLSVLSIDLDLFKKVNDTYGHAAGDAVLKETINRVQVNLRAFDLVVRMGGEEFAVIMPETEEKTAFSVAERLRAAVADIPFELPNGEKIGISASFGVASLDHERDQTPETLLDRVDRALYRAKEDGRNRVVCETAT